MFLLSSGVESQPTFQIHFSRFISRIGSKPRIVREPLTTDNNDTYNAI